MELRHREDAQEETVSEASCRACHLATERNLRATEVPQVLTVKELA
jgi:hypothetical protein